MRSKQPLNGQPARRRRSGSGAAFAAVRSPRAASKWWRVMAMSVVSATWRRIITVTRLRRRVLAELQPMTRRDQAERLRKEWQTCRGARSLPRLAT
jgi:hypothetical protein